MEEKKKEVRREDINEEVKYETNNDIIAGNGRIISAREHCVVTFV